MKMHNNVECIYKCPNNVIIELPFLKHADYLLSHSRDLPYIHRYWIAYRRSSILSCSHTDTLLLAALAPLAATAGTPMPGNTLSPQ